MRQACGKRKAKFGGQAKRKNRRCREKGIDHVNGPKEKGGK